MRLIIEEHRAASTVAIHLWTGASHRDHRIVAEISLDCVTSSA
jgi:hypothetical protein